MNILEYRLLPYNVDGCSSLTKKGNEYFITSGPYRGTKFRYQIQTDWLVSVNRADDPLKVPWLDITTGLVKIKEEIEKEK